MATPSKPSNSPAQAVNKKVARAARAGGGPVVKTKRKADSFTFTVIAVILAGIALIGGSVYGRRILESAPFVGLRTPKSGDLPNRPSGPFISKKLRAAEAELKALNDAKKPDAKKVAAAEKKLSDLLGDTHWHAAYGVFKCDNYIEPFDGQSFPDPLGLHAHDDGLVHIHPFLLRVSGRKARMGDWMDSVYLSVNSKRIKLPTPGKRPESASAVVPGKNDYLTIDASKACKDKKGKTVPAQVRMYVWDNKDDKTAAVYSSGFGDVRLNENAVYAFVVAPKDTKIKKPPSIGTLAAPSDVVSPVPATQGVGLDGQPVTTKAGAETPTTKAGTPTTKAAAPTTKAAAPTTKAGATTVAPAPSTTKK